MSNWPLRHLGDMADFIGGGTPSRSRSEFWGGDIRWASIKDFSTHSLRSTLESITSEGLANSTTKLITPGHVIVASRVGLGKVAINEIPVAINQDLKAILLKPGTLLPRYLLYFLISKAGHLEHLGVGATVKGLTTASFQSLTVPVPSHAEQERIVRLLDEADAIRKLRAQADQRTADLIPALFHDMFGDPITNPMGWPITRLSDVADVQGGLQLSPKRASYDLRRPYLRVANVQRGRLDLSEIKSIDLTQDEYGRVKLRSGDLLLVEGNGNPKEVGRAAIWDGSIDGVVHQNHLIRVRTKPEVLRSEFLLSFINSDAGRSFFVESGNSTSGLVTISTGIVKSCRFPMPSSDVQQRFVERIASVQATRSRQSHSMVAGQAAFEAVLDGVFTTKD